MSRNGQVAKYGWNLHFIIIIIIIPPLVLGTLDVPTKRSGKCACVVHAQSGTNTWCGLGHERHLRWDMLLDEHAWVSGNRDVRHMQALQMGMHEGWADNN